MGKRTFSLGYLGDSLGDPVSSFNWQHHVRDELARRSGKNVILYHSSIHDNSSAQLGMALAATYGRIGPDALLIEYNHNDFQKMTLADSAYNHTYIVNTIKNLSRTKPYLMPMPLLASTWPDYAAKNAVLAQFNDQYRRLASELGIGLVDLAGAWGPSDPAQFYDGAHPTLAAHLAKTVPTVVDAILPQALAA